MTKQERKDGFVDFCRRVGIVAGAALAVISLSSIAVKAASDAASKVMADAVSKAVAKELAPIVDRLNDVETYTRVVAKALKYPIGSSPRMRILAELDSLDVRAASAYATSRKERVP